MPFIVSWNWAWWLVPPTKCILFIKSNTTKIQTYNIHSLNYHQKMYLHNEHAFCELHFFSFCYDYPFFDHDKMVAQYSIFTINKSMCTTNTLVFSPCSWTSCFCSHSQYHNALFYGVLEKHLLYEIVLFVPNVSQPTRSKLFSVLVLQQCTYLNIVIFNHLCPWFHVHSRWCSWIKFIFIISITFMEYFIIPILMSVICSLSRTWECGIL